MASFCRLIGAALLCFMAATAQAQPIPSGPGTPSLPPPDPTAKESQDAMELAAQLTAERWLRLLDAGEYTKAWNQCSQLFRQRVPREKWLESVPVTRKPFGAMKARRTEVASRKTSLPGVPDGDYVTVRFNTTFENKANAEELMTLVLENGIWRPTGYFIK